MVKIREAAGGGPAYQRLPDGKHLHRVHDRNHDHSFSDTGKSSRKLRTAQKRADLQASLKDRREGLQTAGTVWACCVGTEIIFVDLLQSVRRFGSSTCSITIDSTYSEVLFCHCFPTSRICFIFRFGCVVAWDMDFFERQQLMQWLEQFVKEPLGEKKEDDDMNYVWAERATIKADHIHLVTVNIFEKLAYSYACAQSVKLAVFETVVDDTIEKTRAIPEGLAQTGKINSTREDIGRRMGELFVNRFYINLHTDILDTPDIFWDNDDFADHYDKCRRYLEIPKRVEILNQRLDIIKDLYEMLNNELTIQHGYKLEWIVIYLICIEVLIEVLWNIIVRDLLHWV